MTMYYIFNRDRFHWFMERCGSWNGYYRQAEWKHLPKEQAMEILAWYAERCNKDNLDRDNYMLIPNLLMKPERRY